MNIQTKNIEIKDLKLWTENARFPDKYFNLDEKELNDVLSKLLAGNESLKKQQIGGIKSAAEIMNYMSGASEASVMAGFLLNIFVASITC